MFGHEKSASILSNNSSQLPYLDAALGKAMGMLHERAYLHHFERYGVTRDVFDEAFMMCEDALVNYQ